MIMKAIYMTPSTEVIRTEFCSLMTAVSGPTGMKDGGQDNGTAIPQ